MYQQYGGIELTMSKRIDGLLQEESITAAFEFTDYGIEDAYNSKCFVSNDKEWYRHNLYELVDLIVERL